jgi:hypothetical protein
MFFPANSQDFGGLDLADKVPGWMHTAAQVSIGGRKQVLEDRRDVCDSESDSENEDHGEVLSGMYTKDIPLDSKRQPIDARHKLSAEKVSALGAQAAGLDAESLRSTTQASAGSSYDPTIHSSPTQERKLTPVNSDDEDPNMSFDQQRHLKVAKKKSTKEAAKSTHGMTTRQNAQASDKGQERPEPVPVKAPKKKASRAGSLRSAVGSGSTDTCVPPGHPSQT